MTSRTIRELRDELTGAAETLFDGLPVYLVLGSELPAEYSSPVLGFAGRAFDATLKPFLADWRGRGVAVVLNDRQILRWASSWMYTRPCSRPAMLRRMFASVVVHELTHVATDGWLPTVGENTKSREPEIAAWCLLLSARGDEQPIPEVGAIPWLGHDGPWVRLLLHVAHRFTRAARLWFAPDYEWSLYGISPPWRYAGALGNEPEQLAHVPLTEIVGIDPPEAFVRLWRDDLKSWFLAIDSPTHSQTDMYVYGLSKFPFFPKGKPSMSTVLSTIGNAFARRQRKQADSYGDLVRSIATGTKIDANDAAEILDEAGKTPEALAADVTLRNRRVALRKVYDSESDLIAEAAELRRKIAAADAVLTTAEEHHETVVAPLAHRLQAIGVEHIQRMGAADELRHTAPPELAEEIAKLAREIGRLQNQIGPKQQHVDYLKQQTLQELALTHGYMGLEPRKMDAADRAQVKSEQSAIADRRQTELDVLVVQRDELIARQNELLAQQLRV